MHFEITIKPDEGYYRNGKFLFDFQISTGYPYDAPKVKCKTKVRAAEPYEISSSCLRMMQAGAADVKVRRCWLQHHMEQQQVESACAGSQPVYLLQGLLAPACLLYASYTMNSPQCPVKQA